ncbi:MAG: class I SAM-dependent methyltransferase [bacterium]|nr:class I SAM-dependent methyltransferase [bacterium]
MSTGSDRLSSKEDWSDKWSGQAIEKITFNPQQPGFRDQHRILMRTLPHNADVRFLEIGCYLGYMMWYFHHYFGYQVSGLEYVDWCCDKARELLAGAGVPGDVIHGDLFTWKPESPETQ